jgi:acetyl-CoA hydrolase
MNQRQTIGQFRMFIGGSYSGNFREEHADCVEFVSYAAIGESQSLARAGKLAIIPVHYSRLAELMSSGRMAVDVALIQLSPPDELGRHSLGMANDYVIEIARRARVVIAEINAAAPWTYGSMVPEDVRIDRAVNSRIEPARPAYKDGGAGAGVIAGIVAGLVPDGATIEIGVGTIPDRILLALEGHRDLGIHSGTIGEKLIDLVESGVVTNARKPIDSGRSVLALLCGGNRLAAFAHRNPAIELRPSSYTHAPSTLSRIKGLVAINSALEVDLTGQINAEVLDGCYVGAIGGLVDFGRGAALAENGRSIVALLSTARGGAVSRIVPRLDHSPVTLGRSDVDTVVTEWGAAEIKGTSLRERARQLVAIAHPDFRESLEREAHRIGKAGW